MSGIYYLTTIKDDYRPRYVGQARDCALRLSHHIYNSRTRRYKSKLYSWIKSRVAEGYEILAYKLEDPALWNVAEVFWIKTMRRRHPDLLNGTDGGTGGKTGNNSQKLKKFWQEVREGKRPSPPLNPGKPWGPEQRQHRRWNNVSPEILEKERKRRSEFSKRMWDEIHAGVRPWPRGKGPNA